MVAGTVVSSKGVQIIVNANGTFIYDPTSTTQFDSLGNNQTSIDTFDYTVKDPQGGETTSTAIIEVTGTLPTSDVDLTDGAQTITLNAVVQELLKGSSGDNVTTLSGKAVSGDVYDGGTGADTLKLDGSGDNVIAVQNTEIIQGSSKDDEIEIQSPGTGGVTVTSEGGDDKITLGEGFTFGSANLSGNDLVVSTDYKDPSDAARPLIP